LTRAVEVVRTYLELRSPAQLRGVAENVPGLEIPRRDGITSRHYRRLYAAVGAAWHWRDRDLWSDDRLQQYLASPSVGIWECLMFAEAAGFFELMRQPDGSVEIAYFGLTSAFIGRGIGKALLTRAVEEAWKFGAARVWLHTCTLDSPHALPNYKARLRGSAQGNIHRRNSGRVVDQRVNAVDACREIS
jgi:GNAT superfamily N-acetyltransferase